MRREVGPSETIARSVRRAGETESKGWVHRHLWQRPIPESARPESRRTGPLRLRMRCEVRSPHASQNKVAAATPDRRRWPGTRGSAAGVDIAPTNPARA